MEIIDLTKPQYAKQIEKQLNDLKNTMNEIKELLTELKKLNEVNGSGKQTQFFTN